ncbi:MAG: hypothetical protein ABR875_00065 [Minisyncoccia bacterium]
MRLKPVLPLVVACLTMCVGLALSLIIPNHFFYLTENPDYNIIARDNSESLALVIVIASFFLSALTYKISEEFLAKKNNEN